MGKDSSRASSALSCTGVRSTWKAQPMSLRWVRPQRPLDLPEQGQKLIRLGERYSPERSMPHATRSLVRRRSSRILVSPGAGDHAAGASTIQVGPRRAHSFAMHRCQQLPRHVRSRADRWTAESGPPAPVPPIVPSRSRTGAWRVSLRPRYAVRAGHSVRFVHADDFFRAMRQARVRPLDKSGVSQDGSLIDLAARHRS